MISKLILNLQIQAKIPTKNNARVNVAIGVTESDRATGTNQNNMDGNMNMTVET
jgi:hypothetical protein